MLARATSRLVPVSLGGLLLLSFWLGAQEQEKPKPEEPAAEAAAATVVIPAGTHIPLVLQNSVNTKTAQVGDPLYFESVYPVVVNNRILIPVGSFVRGTLTQVKRPGRVKGRGELHVRFDELTLPNGYTVNLSASLAGAGAGQNEEVDRQEGGIKSDSTKSEDIGVVAGGGAVGAGIGAATTRGGGTGTGLGAGLGGAAGLAYVLLTRGKELELPRGTTVDIELSRPLELDAAMAQFDWTGQSSGVPGPAPRERNRRPIGRRIPF